MKSTIIATALVSLMFFGQSVRAEDLSEPVDGKVKEQGPGAVKLARVFFIEPKDGATTGQKVKVKMGVEGIKVRPAGEAPDEVTSGHHHIIVDKGSEPAGQVIAMDPEHLHFGKGQTETELTLKPGHHTLTLQFADGAHRSFGEKMSQTIHINVK